MAGGHESLLAYIEPIIVKIILQMARIRQYLTPSMALRLVNDLIDCTKMQQDLIKWKKTIPIMKTGKLDKDTDVVFLKGTNIC